MPKLQTLDLALEGSPFVMDLPCLDDIEQEVERYQILEEGLQGLGVFDP